MYDDLIAELRQHHCDAKEDDTQEVCEECAYDVIIADKTKFSGIKSVCVCGLMHRAADAIEELQAQLMFSNDAAKTIAEKVPKWIPVTVRLPEEEESVFVVRKFLGIKGQVPPSTYTEIAYRIGDRWVADSDEYKIVRHRHTDPLFWMPLPEPPKEEGE